MYVNSCNVLAHILSFRLGSEECAERQNTDRLVLRAGKLEHTYQFQRAFRIRLADGLNSSKAVSTSFAPSHNFIIAHLRHDFHCFQCPLGHFGLLTRVAGSFPSGATVFSNLK